MLLLIIVLLVISFCSSVGVIFLNEWFCRVFVGVVVMKPETFAEYKLFLDNLSQSDFEGIKHKALSSRVYYRDLDIGECVCPLAEDVRDRSDCKGSCALYSFCPNFIN